jgi:hypothetical protein
MDELRRVDAATPADANTIRGSVVLATDSGTKRVILVAMSELVPSGFAKTGAVSSRVSVLSWPSSRDIVCLYDRPGESGDVGEVTRAVVKATKKLGGSPALCETGRTMGVIRDLLVGRNMRSL